MKQGTAATPLAASYVSRETPAIGSGIPEVWVKRCDPGTFEERFALPVLVQGPRCSWVAVAPLEPVNDPMPGRRLIAPRSPVWPIVASCAGNGCLAGKGLGCEHMFESNRNAPRTLGLFKRYVQSGRFSGMPVRRGKRAGVAVRLRTSTIRRCSSSRRSSSISAPSIKHASVRAVRSRSSIVPR